jgi:lipopolysaccharide/colanic/teichoic acid biosynthesis glycosyltransferase
VTGVIRPADDASPEPLPISVAADPGGLLERAVDLTVAVLGLAISAPLLTVLALVIRLDSPGPGLYRGTRLGLGGRPFTVYKLRSMRTDTSDDLHREYVVNLLRGEQSALPERGDTGVNYKLAGDPRVTRLGGWLRRSTLDELPQLLNVVRGEMSLVGPRPEVPYALEAYENWHYERFAVKPGLTGLWQVSGRGELSPRDMLALDVEYARSRSFALDVRILIRTVPAVLRRRGAR